MRFFRVGGCVRDEILGRRSKDIDYSVEIDETDFKEFESEDPFQVMRQGLLSLGYEIFVESPQYLTIRAFDPVNHEAADFVLCRRDGEYVDGRHPETVEPGTILDDLARRDFCMNAIAQDADGILLDPYNGLEDIARKQIRCVGKPEQRFTEDALRMLRAIRFAVVLGFEIEHYTARVIKELAPTIERISVERIYEELKKAFQQDTLKTLNLIDQFEMREHVFKRGLRLEPTMKA